jgi:protein SCO1/2
MRSALSVVSAVSFGLALVLAVSPRVPAQETVGRIVDQVGFDQNLGAQLPLDLHFRDDSGRDVTLGDLFGRRPVILAPVYYRCPMVCNQVLNGLTRSLKPLSTSAGRDFDVAALSIDPDETPELAGQKKSSYLERYDRPGSESGWHFLTGQEPAIAALTRAIGFRYTYNPRTKLYAHAAGVVIVTPSGRIARYFYGIDYDAATGKYTLSILRLIRVCGTATAVALGGFLVVMFRRERKGRRNDLSPGDHPGRNDFSTRPEWSD